VSRIRNTQKNALASKIRHCLSVSKFDPLVPLVRSAIAPKCDEPLRSKQERMM